jgi:hypothetical protein
MATEKDMRDRFLLLLWSPAAAKVEFTFDGVFFHGCYFHLVATGLVMKGMGQKGIGFLPGAVAPGSDAGYSPSRDAFKIADFNYGTNVFQRQALIHEAIHAYLDIAKSSKPALTDEGVAYIGGLLFHIHDTTPAGGTPTAPSWATSGIFKEAYRIASGIVSSGATVVSAADVKAMHDAIKADSTYTALKDDPTIKYGNNGVW